MEHQVAKLIIEIKPSKMLLGQIGLFAARDLDSDFLIAEASKLGEEFVLWERFEEIDEITKAKILQYCLQTNQGFYMPPERDLNYLTVPWNMNHSCLYNVGFDNDGNFITAREVKKGEELVWDYGMGISNSKFRLDCKCGSAICRGVVTGDDWKNSDYRNRNSKYFLRELLNN